MFRLIVLLLVVPLPLLAQALPFSDPAWELRGDSTRVDTVGGVVSVRMVTGRAVRRDVRLMDGTIDADVMMVRRRSFVFVGFRMADDENHEEFYARPHKSTLPDAVQYTPVYRGVSAWQLFHGPGATAAADVATGVWQHLRIVLSGRRAAVFLGDTVTPVLIVPRLHRQPVPGYVALYAFNASQGSGPIARFANVRVRPDTMAYQFGPPVPDPTPVAGLIDTWAVGESFRVTDTAFTTLPAPTRRQTGRVRAGPGGLIELNEQVPMPAGFTSVAGNRPDVGIVARVTVTADRAGVRRLDLGFSDAVTLFLNGQPLFHGDDSYEFEQRRDGLIGFDQAAVYLPLRAGPNELAVVVTDHFGGWGLMARFPDMHGLRVQAE
jgi:hypothetical protein